MKVLGSYLCACSFLYGAVSVVLPPGKTGIAPFPGFSNASSFRIEGRIHNRTVVAGSYAYAVQLGNAQNAFTVSWGLGPNDRVSCIVQNNQSTYGSPPPTDFEFRVQRIVAGASATRTCEIWDIGATNAALVFNTSAPIAPTIIPAGNLTIGHASANFSMAYLKVFSTAVATGGSAPSANYASVGDIHNFLFEGTTAAELGADTSGRKHNITWSDGTAPATMPTPTYGPVCGAGTTKIFRAGETLTASAATSWSRNEARLQGYEWKVNEYPAGVEPLIRNNDTKSETLDLENTVFGQYVLALTVTDASGSASCTVTHGVVAHSTDGVVIYPSDIPAAIRILIGPLIAPGKSPTSWLDVAATQSADHFDSLWGTRTATVDRKGYWDDDPQNWGPGTVTIAQSDTSISPNPGTKVVCNDPGTCGFRSRVCNASGVAISGATLFINYPAWEGGGNFAVQGGYASAVRISTGEHGWLYASVSSCPSDDEVRLTAPINVGAPKGTSMTGLNWSFFTGTPSPVLAWSSAQPTAVDFYDSGLAFYSMYYRTGLTKYLTRARYIADRHYSNAMSLNKGLPYRAGEDYTNDGQQQAFRDINLTSVIIRALDGKPGYWTGIRRVCNVSYGNGGGAGDREAGYALTFEAACALADPDPVQRATWVARLNKDIAGFEAHRCGGSAGRVCHGRDFGQWITDAWASCGSSFGVLSRNSPPGCEAFTKKGWKVRLTHGSPDAEFINGDMTFPPGHQFAGQPFIFGHDSTTGPACIASGSGTTFTCSTTPATTAYTTGMQILIRLPVTALNPTINIDGLGAKSIVNTNGGSISLIGGSNYALWYNGTHFRLIQVLTSFYPRLTPDLGYAKGDDIGRAFHWPEKVDSTRFKLKKFSLSPDRASVPYENWPKATGDYHFMLDGAAFVGSRTQPFMMGIIMRGVDLAYEATVRAGSPNATALMLLSDAAQWLVKYAYDPLSGGLYFARVTPGCEAESGYGVMPATISPIPGSCLSDMVGARGLVPEIIGAMAAAYLRETDATRKAAIRTAMVRWIGKIYGKPGYSCTGDYAAYCGDGSYLTLIEETYTPGSFNYDVDKYLGFALGFGGSFAWPSAERHTEWPRIPVPRTASISFRLSDVANATLVRVTLKDNTGVLVGSRTECTSSPCSVTIPDKQAGNLLIKLEYLSTSGGPILAASEFQKLQNVE